jgi:hypothetical protein
MNSVRHIFRAVAAGVLVLVAGRWMMLPAGQANASTPWYVSSSGSDTSGCGSSANPCKSITYVLTSIPAFADGDTINVSGVLAENVNVGRPAVIVGQTSDATIQAAGVGSVLSVPAGVSVTLSGLTIRNGNAGDGGGIHNQGILVASGVVITGNSATNSGGGIFNTGTLTMTNGKVAGNRVLSPGEAGGGIENTGALFLSDVVIEHNKASTYGGGIDNFGGHVNLVRVIIRKNEAASGAGIINDNLGTLMGEASAIVENAASNQGGGISNSSSLVLRNVTLSGNSLSAGPGAGLFNLSATARASLSFVSIVSNTIVNQSSAEASGLYVGPDSHVALTATVIAYNSVRNCVAADGGVFQSFDHNVSSDAHCSFLTQPRDATGVDPQLAPLRFGNGTYTHGPMQNSALLDVVDPAGCLSQDQRGVSRPQGPKCDVGAHEATPAELDSADLALAANAPSSVTRASVFTVELRVNNLGPNAAKTPVVTTTLPADAQFISASGANWACSLSNVTVVCNYQSALMPVGMAPAIFIALRAPQSEVTLQTASIVSTLSSDPDMNNNANTATSSVIITNTKVYVPVVRR